MVEIHGKSTDMSGNLWKSHDFDGVTRKDGGLFWKMDFDSWRENVMIKRSDGQNTRTHNPGREGVKGDGEKDIKL